MKKILIAILALLVVGYFVFMNTVAPKFVGNFILSDGGEWTEVSADVTKGDADKFEIELATPQSLKVTYDGEFDFSANITLTDAAGNTARYEMLIYKDWNTVTDTSVTVSELNEIE